MGRGSLRLAARSDSVLSARSEQSSPIRADNDMGTADGYESLSLLETDRDNSVANATPENSQQFVINEDQLRRVMKRAMEPLMYEVKRIKTENAVLDKKVSQVLSQNEVLQKMVKELKAELNKGTEDLPLLLTGDGVQFLKEMCVRNLDMKAKDDVETALLQKFMDKAKEEGWLIKRTGKSEKDIISKFRDNRNYLKAQVKLRISEDLSNQTPITSSKLPKTLKFIREHLSVPELSNEILLILYNYAYVALKYINKGIAGTTMSETEKNIQERARKNVWLYVMDRVEQDREAKKEASAIKEKICRMLTAGTQYEPLTNNN